MEGEGVGGERGRGSRGGGEGVARDERREGDKERRGREMMRGRERGGKWRRGRDGDRRGERWGEVGRGKGGEGKDGREKG